MFDFSGYLIASDLDGTLFDKSSHIAPGNLEAIERFRAGGGLFTVNTGRTHHSIRCAIQDVEGLVNAPIVHCNGAYLYDFHKKEFLSEQIMPEANTRALLDFLLTKHPEMPFRAMARHQIRYYTPPGRTLSDVAAHFADPDAFCDDPTDTWPMEDWYKLVLLDAKDVKEQIVHEITAHTGLEYGFTASGASILEIQTRGCDKALGIEKLRHHHPPAKGRCIIACGDYDNDVPALAAADIAICPENANENAKALAGHVLCHCNDGLIAAVVRGIEEGSIQKSF